MKSIIWNLTRACVWNCSFCCVAAENVSKVNAINELKSSKFSNELDHDSKKRVIDSLTKGKYRIDFSGGELLIDPSNLELIRYASDKLGKENIGISISGAFVDDNVVEMLKDKVNDVEITLDYIPYTFYPLRPVGYHEYAAHAMLKLKKAGIRVGAQTVVTNKNISKEMLFNLFNWLEGNNIDEWSILRFFKSGRGRNNFEPPSHQQYAEMVDYVRKISEGSKLKVNFQYLLPNHENYTYNCRAVKKSIGILPDGIVIGCFWALDQNMKPINEDFILGKVPEQNIEDILNNEKSKKFLQQEKKCAFFCKEVLEDDVEKESIDTALCN